MRGTVPHYSFQIGSALVSDGFEVFGSFKQDLMAYLRANSYHNIGEVLGEAHT
ncbi:MAG: hypothetical protein ACP5E9_07430 [Candidatus Methanospirareceae archaeon]